MNITITNKTKATIKPMHGVGQAPFFGTDFSMVRYLKDAGIPYSRLHDVGGYYGGFRFVDIPNIFRDFNADPYDAASYDFIFTDMLISALVENGVEPFFRLGVTIENDAKIKAYRIYPPEDYKKWAIVCEHIIRHYTEGWADGFYHDIKYWEIWNEPDNYEDIYENQMWRGTKEQYYELYRVASTHLKEKFPHLKIGGYGSCGFYAITEAFIAGANSSPRSQYFIEFFDGFLKFIKENNCPFDFFSWHSYDGVENNRKYIDYARERLDLAGYKDTELICNEWNLEIHERGTARHAALVCAMMLSFQNSHLDSAMFYDAQWSVCIYGSMFEPNTGKPYPAYYAFMAYNELYKMGEQIELEIDGEGIYGAAAKCGENACILISNPTGNDVEMNLHIDGKIEKCIITCDGKTYEEIEFSNILPKNSFVLLYAKI